MTFDRRLFPLYDDTRCVGFVLKKLCITYIILWPILVHLLSLLILYEIFYYIFSYLTSPWERLGLDVKLVSLSVLDYRTDSAPLLAEHVTGGGVETGKVPFLSAFAKFRKAAISFVTSVAWNISAPNGSIYVKLNVWIFFENLSRIFEFRHIWARITGTVPADQYTVLIISRSTATVATRTRRSVTLCLHCVSCWVCRITAQEINNSWL